MLWGTLSLRYASTTKAKEGEIMETTFHIDNMKCQGCAANVEKAAQSIPGVESVSVDLANKTATVSFENVSKEAIQSAIQEAGYHAE